MEGALIGSYRLIHVLDATSDMVIYAASEPTAKGGTHPVSVLMPRPYVIADPPMAFAFATQALARRPAPGLPPISDFGRYEGRTYAVLPRLPGGLLSRALHAGAPAGPSIAEPGAVAIVLRVADGARLLDARLTPGHFVQPAPESVWVSPDGSVYLLPNAVRVRSRRSNAGAAGKQEREEELVRGLSALLWDLLAFRSRERRSDSPTTRPIAEAINPALFRAVLWGMSRRPGRTGRDLDTFTRYLEALSGRSDPRRVDLRGPAEGQAPGLPCE